MFEHYPLPENYATKQVVRPADMNNITSTINELIRESGTRGAIRVTYAELYNRVLDGKLIPGAVYFMYDYEASMTTTGNYANPNITVDDDVVVDLEADTGLYILALDKNRLCEDCVFVESAGAVGSGARCYTAKYTIENIKWSKPNQVLSSFDLPNAGRLTWYVYDDCPIRLNSDGNENNTTYYQRQPSTYTGAGDQIRMCRFSANNGDSSTDDYVVLDAIMSLDSKIYLMTYSGAGVWKIYNGPDDRYFTLRDVMNTSDLPFNSSGPGAPFVGGKGTILRLTDENRHVSTPYDFLHLKCKGRYTFCDNYSMACHENSANNNNIYIGDMDVDGRMPNFNVFYGSNQNIKMGNGCHSNTFSNCSSIEFKTTCYNNTFGDGCSTMSFDAECSVNTFGESCNNITFGHNCSDNTFGESCYGASFGSNCSSNTIGSDTGDITFGHNCSDNAFDNCHSISFGSNCWSNTLNAGCNNMTFGNGCSDNIFVSGCIDISFGEECSSNIFDACSSISFSPRCHGNTIGEGSMSISFGPECHGNTIGEGCMDISFGPDCTNNTINDLIATVSFGPSCRSNTLGLANYAATGNIQQMGEIEMGPDCYSNVFEKFTFNIKLGPCCYSNTFKAGSSTTTFTGTVTFGSKCYSNIIYGNARYITFGNGCYSNRIWNTALYVTFGEYCYTNHVKGSCQSVEFGNFCNNNNIGGTTAISKESVTNNTSSNITASCKYIRLENHCTYVSTGKGCENIHVGANSSYIALGAYERYINIGQACTRVYFASAYATSTTGTPWTCNYGNYLRQITVGDHCWHLHVFTNLTGSTTTSDSTRIVPTMSGTTPVDPPSTDTTEYMGNIYVYPYVCGSSSSYKNIVITNSTRNINDVKEYMLDGNSKITITV